MIETHGYGAEKTGAPISPLTFSRNPPQRNELLIEIIYCGLCHSDVELLANNWGITKYPCVPGHEAVGRVVAQGPEATRFRVGDVVGVGNMVDSCLQCPACVEGWENHCEGPNGPTLTQSGYLMPKTKEAAAYNTLGAWSSSIVVREEFVIPIPKGLDIARVAPLMCAGTDTYGPLRRFNITPETRIGIVGLGGPGHIAVQMAKAMGAAHVVVFTTHPDKRDAVLLLGADEVVVSSDALAMSKLSRSLHCILSTIPVAFDPSPYLATLRRRGQMTVIALLGPFTKVINNIDLAAVGLSLTGSMIGSVTETKESLEFCAEHGIMPLIEIIKPDQINEAIERLKMADVRFRFVIEMKDVEDRERAQ